MSPKRSIGLAIGALDLVARAERLDDQVDRTVLQMQAAVGKRAATAIMSTPHLVAAQHVFQRDGARGVAAQRRIVVGAQGELDRRHQRRRRHVAEGLLRHARHIDHEGDAAARPDIGRRAAQVTLVRVSRTERVSRTGFSVTPARSEPPAPAMNSTVQSAGSQFSAMRSTTWRTGAGIVGGLRLQVLVELEPGRMLAGGRDHQQRRPGQACLGSIFSMISSGSVMSVPPQPRPGSATWK